jgi:N-acetylglucosamine-6-phosphate deacetylase
VNAAPSSLEGTWDVVLSPGPLKPGALTLVIDKDNAVVVKKQAAEEPTPAEAAPKPEAKPPEGAVGGAGAAAEKAEPEKTAEKPKKAAESKARGVVFANGRLSFVFEHAPFGEAGVFTMSGVVSPDKVGMLGDGVRADGARFAWTATRRPEPPKAEPAKEEPAKEGAAKPDGEAKEPAQQEAAKPDAAKKDGKGEEEEEPLDIPEALPGYPFGPYALAKPPQLDRVAIVNATVWTSAAAGIIRDGAVVISEGKIVYVGAAAAMPRLGEGFVTFDAQGKHVTPGIVDCHSHTGISKGVNEAGQAVTAEVRIGDVTDPDSISWYRQLAGGVTAVNNLHGSANPIGGQNQVNKNRWGVARPDGLHLEGAIPGIKFALGENVKQSNWGDRFTGRYPQTRMGVEALIRDRFLAAQAYTRAWAAHAAANGEGVLKGMPASFVNSVKKNAGTAAVAVSPSAAGGKDAPPRRDLELEALAEILAGERLVHCHSYRQDEILMLARVAQEFGFKIGTYQHILEGYKVAEAVRDFSGGGSAFSDWWGFKVEVQDAIPQAGPIMHEQGAVVSYNSDSDELARRMNVEAAKAVKYSLVAGVASVSPEEALKFVTINPAKQLRIDGRVGSLEAGKDADVVVWTADPLSVYARAERTWVDGRLYFSLERDAELRARDAKERQRLLQKLLAEGKKPKGEEKAAEGEGGGAAGGGGGAPGRRRPRPPQGGDEAGVLAGDAGDGSSAARASDEPRTLLSRMHRDAVVYRRELYLDLLRRGLDPAWARSGDCGCDATGAVQ